MPSEPRTDLRALHLFANFKWTGPADPAIRTARALRALGVDAMFALAAAPADVEDRMAIELRRNRVPVIGGLRLPKHYGPSSAWQDGSRLAVRLRRGDFGLLHANLLSDHIVASLAKRRARSARVLLVRTIHEPEAPPRNLRSRFAFANTDGFVVPTRGCAEEILRRFRLAEERVHVQEPTTDWQRFDRIPGDMRSAWGIGADHFVIGITARIQPYRQFGLLWEVARAVVDEHPEARFVLLGRGHPDDVREHVERPIERLGLRDHVLLPGYLHEPEYSRALKSMDLFLFLVPGSDGTCRAAREAIAAGLPIVTSKRGILPDLVSRRYDGPAPEPCGLPIEEDVEQMSKALIRLIRNPAARQRLRDAGRVRVTELMDEAKAGRALLRFYESLRELQR